ncbi:SAM-dependent methyltransferase [Cryptosporangium minutisporangium]|uniref:S-adenosyl methyltransferase n=1 Tax=Cryptosporangium minutisporangium TaxID=113569 RepID=A0ABP6SZY9_9ACTN
MGDQDDAALATAQVPARPKISSSARGSSAAVAWSSRDERAHRRMLERAHEVVLWDPAAGRVVRTLRGLSGQEGMPGRVDHVRFSPDGRLMAVAGDDGAIRVWDIAGDGDPVVLTGTVGQITAIGFSPDGTLIAGVGTDGTVRLWNTDGSGEALTFDQPADALQLVFSADGRQLNTVYATNLRIMPCEVCGPIDEVLALAEQRTTRGTREVPARSGGGPCVPIRARLANRPVGGVSVGRVLAWRPNILCVSPAAPTRGTPDSAGSMLSEEAEKGPMATETPSDRAGDFMTRPIDPDRKPVAIDTGVPHPARVMDFWLGGKDHFAADRAVGEQIVAGAPILPVVMRAERQFIGRAVGYLAGTCEVRQFLDIGTGIPTAGNTHEVAQAVAPESKVVYVDNDPIVLAHARALLVAAPPGTVDYIDADLRDVGRVLEAASGLLDFSQPVAVTVLGILEFIDDDQVAQILAVIKQTLAVGSYVAVASSASEGPLPQAAELWNASGATPITLRTAVEIGAFLDGLELVPPGVVQLPQWRPDPSTEYVDLDVPQYGGLARKA